MDTIKRLLLEAAGFAVGSPAEFLGLTEEDANLVKLRIRPCNNVNSCKADNDARGNTFPGAADGQ